MMLSNEQVLLYLYESMFPSENLQKSLSQPRDRLAMTAGNWKLLA